MKISLSEHFSYKKLLKFTFPSIMMMIFLSIYSVVDGYFVSNYVGKTPFAALNLIWPFIMLCGALGFMVGTGGSALISRVRGEGDLEKANQIFSLLIYVTIGLGIVIAAVGFVFIRPIAVFLGADAQMLDYCVLYGRTLLCSLVAFMLQNVFQSFLITAERPDFGLRITIAAGVTNMILDALFVAVFRWGLLGAAVATAMSQVVGGLVPLFYFVFPNKSPFRLGKTKFDGKALLKTFTNGSSEFVTNISLSVVGMLYNYTLLQIAGEDGLSAYGILMYVGFIFIAVFLGYTIGTAPIVSFHYGAADWEELKNLNKKSLRLIAVFSVTLTALGMALARPLSWLFASYDETLLNMTIHAMILYATCYLLSGFNIYASSFFTALNDGATSAAISFLRTFVFQAAAVLLVPRVLPPRYQLDGIWLACTAAELVSLVISVSFLLGKRKKYHY